MMHFPNILTRFFGRITILIFVLLAILATFWFTVGRRWLDEYLVSISYEEHTFVIPPRAEPLPGVVVSASQNGIDLCNRTQEPLLSVALRINKTYIASLTTVEPSQCKHLAIQEFHGDTWKRIPADKGTDIEDIEVLSTVKRTYYSRQLKGNQ
jgi:hypothetical protein